jgi:putative phage-type endonuclease
MTYDVLFRTDSMPTEEWLAERRKGFGGSDAGVMKGLSQYNSWWGLWHEKVGLYTPIVDNDAVLMGNTLERPAAEIFARKTNMAVVWWPVMLRSKAHPQMLANVDFVIVEDPDRPGGVVYDHLSLEPPAGMIAILEVKTTGIVSPGSPMEWAFDGVPATFVEQGKHYATVMNLPTVHYIALIGGQGPQTRVRTFTQEEMAELVAFEAERWLEVQNRIQPPLDRSKGTLEAIEAMWPKHQPGKRADATREALVAVQTYAALGEQEGAIKKARKTYRPDIEFAFKDAEELWFEERLIATWRNTSDSMEFDYERFARENPVLAKQYLVVKPGSRRLLTKE